MGIHKMIVQTVIYQNKDLFQMVNANAMLNIMTILKVKIANNAITLGLINFLINV